jgi:hypothetical protein
LFAHLWNWLLYASSKSGLSPADVRLLDAMLAQWDRHSPGSRKIAHKDVEMALRRLQWELKSSRADDVIEALEREIDYRLWCDRNTSSEPLLTSPEPAKSNRSISSV